MAFLYLLIAVIAEVLATSALKATNGFTAPLPIVLTIIVKLLYYSYKIRKKLEITHRLSRSTILYAYV